MLTNMRESGKAGTKVSCGEWESINGSNLWQNARGQLWDEFLQMQHLKVRIIFVHQMGHQIQNVTTDGFPHA